MSEAAKRANVLFVDDEPRVLSSMRALFRRDYNVHLANSGNEALALLDREDMDVIVSDQRMPGMTGVDVLKACKERAPRAMRILLTGYADKDAIAASINDGEVFRYLTKPCARDTLRETLALAVNAAGSSVRRAISRPAERVRAPRPLHAPALQTRDHSRISTDSPAPAIRPLTRRAPVPDVRNTAVELLTLSTDAEFTAALESALGMSHRLHAVHNVEAAINVLESHPVGVLITDIAVNADEVQTLTTQLKHHVPELVTIVASDHSDAHRLIDLINAGQVFRFLLKPIKPTQTSIWIESAVGKHLDLVGNPELLARHAVAAPSSGLMRIGEGLLRSIADRFMRFRDRTADGSPQ